MRMRSIWSGCRRSGKSGRRTGGAARRRGTRGYGGGTGRGAEQLKSPFDSGVLTDEQYAAEKQKILAAGIMGAIQALPRELGGNGDESICPPKKRTRRGPARSPGSTWTGRCWAVWSSGRGCWTSSRRAQPHWSCSVRRPAMASRSCSPSGPPRPDGPSPRSPSATPTTTRRCWRGGGRELHQIEALPAEVASALAAPEPNIEGAVLPRLGQAIEARHTAAVLVLDELEHIESPHSLLVIRSLVEHMRSGGRSRSPPARAGAAARQAPGEPPADRVRPR